MRSLNFASICFVGAVLSDHKKRTMYDAGLYDPEEEEDEVSTEYLRNFNFV